MLDRWYTMDKSWINPYLYLLENEDVEDRIMTTNDNDGNDDDSVIKMKMMKMVMVNSYSSASMTMPNVQSG